VLTSGVVTNGNGPITWQWKYANSIISNTSDVFIGQQGTYTVVATNSFGCADSSSINASSQAPIELDIAYLGSVVQDSIQACQSNSPITLCINSSGSISGFIWSTGGSFWCAENINSSGTYTVVASSWNNVCPSETASVVVSIVPNPTPTVSIVSSAPLCDKDTATLIAPSGFATYLWTSSFPVWNNTGNMLKIFQTGDYFLSVTDANNCTNVQPTPTHQRLVLELSTDAICLVLFSGASHH